MKCIDGKLIKYKEIYSFFNRPRLVDYLVKLDDIYDLMLDEIFIMVELRDFELLKVPFCTIEDMRRFAKNNNLIVKKAYFLEDGKVYIYCY